MSTTMTLSEIRPDRAVVTARVVACRDDANLQRIAGLWPRCHDDP
jgi:hypothetical protein